MREGGRGGQGRGGRGRREGMEWTRGRRVSKKWSSNEHTHVLGSCVWYGFKLTSCFCVMLIKRRIPRMTDSPIAVNPGYFDADYGHLN